MNVRLKVEKCEFAQREANWLSFLLSQTGKNPLNSNIQGKNKPIETKENRRNAVNHRRGGPDEPIHSKSCPTLLPISATAKIWEDQGLEYWTRQGFWADERCHQKRDGSNPF